MHFLTKLKPASFRNTAEQRKRERQRNLSLSKGEN
uniref:Uncharacterized protein n=1 Tax=Anguilla anguilla TaxID=7936 RepID=A0A0E9PPY0_ANGAN